MLALLLNGACGGKATDSDATAVASVQNGQVSVDGQLRNYRVFVPPTLDRRTAAPLVMVLHGGGNTVADTVKTTLFDRQASDGGFIAVYPEGTRREWNAGSCCGSAPRRNADDVGFLTRVLDQVEADHQVDRSRVFVTGVSNGAMMAYRVACDRADRITAVGSVAGAVVSDCQPSRPVSVIEIHGTQDELVPYQGGQTDVPGVETAPAYAPAPEMVRHWADIDGCASPTPPKVAGPVTTESWTGCRDGSAVSLVTVEGGGHVWFAPGLGPANGALDATNAIWTFFSGLHR